MKKHNVLLDSNVYLAARYDFDGNSLLSLSKYCDKGLISLHTNDIIIREVKRHINDDVGLMASQAKNKIKENGELVNGITRDVYKTIARTILAAPSNLIAKFDAYIANATILSNNDLSMVELFDDYFAPRAPFEAREAKKYEFPDAVIIMSIKRYAASLHDEVLHVVTDDDGWHLALQGVANVVLYRKLEDYLAFVARSNEAILYERIMSHVQDHIDDLNQDVLNWVTEQEWESAVEDIGDCIECDMVDDVNSGNIILKPVGIEYLDGEEGYSVVRIAGVVNVKLDFSYTDHSEEVYDREDHCWYNTKCGNGVLQLDMPMDFSVDVYLDENDCLEMDSPDLDDLDISVICNSDFTLKENREDPPYPYYDTCPDCGEWICFHNDGGNGFCSKCAANH